MELGLILMTLSELDHLQRLYLQIRSHSQVQGVRLQQFWGDPMQWITVQELTHTMAIRWWGTTCGTSATRYLMPLLLALVGPEAGPASQSLSHASSLTLEYGERASASFSFPSPPPRFIKFDVLPTQESLQPLGSPKRKLYTTGGNQ